VQVKQLIGIMNRPWAMEPQAASQWSKIARQIFETGIMPEAGLPNTDRRFIEEDWLGLGRGPVFRIDESMKVSKSGAIQVLRMDAPVMKYDYCGSLGSQTFQQIIAAANADPAIGSIILWIDSPGGQVDGTDSLAAAIKESAKPVIAFADGLMASAAYWIGSSCTEVIADGSNNGLNSKIGSIGTMCKWEDHSEALKNEGIKEHIVFADESADKWGDYFKMNAGDYTDLKKELNGLNTTFLNAVKGNREGKLKLDKENVLTGKVYNANDALKYGLIDKIGSFDVAVARAVTLAKQQQKTTKMSGKNLSFQTALAVAGVEAFAVTDAGFAMSEESLNAIDARMVQDAKLIGNLTASNEALEAKVTALESADTAAQVTALTADLATATEAISAKDAEIATLKADLETAKIAAAAKGFLNPGAEGNDKDVDAESKVDLSTLEHNKKAKEMGF
jgi:ClpP class serine protease